MKIKLNKNEINKKKKKRRKKGKRKKSLKKRIRRIIGWTLLLVMILVAIVNIWMARQVVVFGGRILTGTFARFCTMLIDVNNLEKINQPTDIDTPEYKEMVNNLNDAISPGHEFKIISFTVVKKDGDKLINIYDSDKEEGSFKPYKMERQLFSELVESHSVRQLERSYDIITYAPLLNKKGNIAGVFVTRLDRRILMVIFILASILIIFVCIIAYLFSLGMTRVMTRKVTRPLEILDRKIRMVARAEGDLSRRVEFEDTYKEVEELADATNMVMESTGNFVSLLEEKQVRLEDKNQQLGQQAEELEAQTEELIALNENLEEAMEELQDTQIQLIQSEKMASIGQLTAGVAHEINTPLGAINSNTNIVEMVINLLEQELDVEDNPKINNIMEKLKKATDTNKMACERIIEIVRRLKNFSRLDEAEFKEADIEEGIESVLILAHNMLKHRVEVHKEYGDLPLVKCMPNQLNQVFMNLIVNAGQAIEEEGDIWIKTWADQAKDKVYIQIKDNGHGIRKENINKIFDPGFTTKGVGVGTGLGLSICYKIIEKHQGKLEVESEANEGTTFTIELPQDNSIERINKKDKHP